MKTGSIQAEDDLLEGHLCLTRELVSFLGQAKKFEVGADVTKNINLIKVIYHPPSYSLGTNNVKTACIPSF